jgi:hypothetical protein
MEEVDTCEDVFKEPSWGALVWVYSTLSRLSLPRSETQPPRVFYSMAPRRLPKALPVSNDLSLVPFTSICRQYVAQHFRGTHLYIPF